jgi:hypothetical protein
MHSPPSMSSNNPASQDGRPVLGRHLTNSPPEARTGKPIVLGVASMDVKARSKAMREILTRLVEMEGGGVDIKIFGDKVILDEGQSMPCSLLLLSCLLSHVGLRGRPTPCSHSRGHLNPTNNMFRRTDLIVKLC